MTMTTANEAWLNLASQLIHSDDVSSVSPDGVLTYERLFVETKFDMNYPVCYHQDRRLNYAFSAAEAYAITHGVPDEHFLAQYNKNISQFSDDGVIFNGAYGPPFHNQVMYAVDALLNDESSRQSVITIWRPNPLISRDRACTIALQFLIRDKKMHCKVTMRSSDIFLGIPYDFFNFTLMTLRVLTLYNKGSNSNVALGTMHWSAGSSHLYDRDAEKVITIIEKAPDREMQRMPERCFTDWRYVTDSLHACMNKDEQAIVENDLWRIRP